MPWVLTGCSFGSIIGRRCAYPARVNCQAPTNCTFRDASTDRQDEQILGSSRAWRADAPRSGAIHIWRTVLSAMIPVSEELKAVISADELAARRSFSSRTFKGDSSRDAPCCK